MTEPHEYEALFLAHLPFVDRTIAVVARALGIRGDDATELGWWAKERLWENDYALLRKWRRESRLTTYLAVVLTNLGREFRVRRWGRWRPSAAAQRLGPIAVRLEVLYYRDGFTLLEAGELLRTRGETALPDRELAALFARIPERKRPRRVDEREVPLDGIADRGSADDAVTQEEQDDERRHAHDALAAAVARLPDLERTIVRMHYCHGKSLADVARALGVPQKPLYRIRDGALRTLRRLLLDGGVDSTRLRDLMGGELPYDDHRIDDSDDPPSASEERLP